MYVGFCDSWRSTQTIYTHNYTVRVCFFEGKNGEEIIGEERKGEERVESRAEHTTEKGRA